MKRTIKEAAQEAIRSKGIALTTKEIYDFIVEHKLYDFKAKAPKSVLNSVLKKHSNVPSIGKKVIDPCFSVDGLGKYSNL